MCFSPVTELHSIVRLGAISQDIPAKDIRQLQGGFLMVM
jgi:hypothetical protein